MQKQFESTNQLHLSYAFKEKYLYGDFILSFITIIHKTKRTP